MRLPRVDARITFSLEVCGRRTAYGFVTLPQLGGALSRAHSAQRIPAVAVDDALPE